MAHLYKTRLQNYAQKRNISLPTYTCETKGPPHARQFKSQVTIDGNTYAGPEFCSTLKDAEHAAAKVAFMALSPDGAQEDESFYKGLLQELAQKKGLVLPVYATNRSSSVHVPCFVSTVEIAGESYVGEDARTKKQAEMNAAKVAYIALTEGGPRANNATAISNIVGTSSSGSSSLLTAVTHKNEPTLVPTTSKMQTTVKYQVNYSIPNEPEKAKGYLELKDLQDVIEKHTMTFPPVTIHQSQPKSALNVVDFAKPSIKQEHLVIQAGEGSSSNGKKSQSSFNDSITASSAIDSGAARPQSTKILIRPHVQGMTYDGPIQVSDDEWVAMKVNVYENP